MAAQTSGKVPYETLTPYGKKRRTLREHREELRVAVGLLQVAGLYELFEDEVMEINDNHPYWLGYDVDEPDAMDEADDPSTDPMLAVQRATAEERESLARLMVALEGRRRDQDHVEALQMELERARMRAEDLASHLG